TGKARGRTAPSRSGPFPQGAAEGAGPFGDLVRVFFDDVGDFVEQLVDRDESGTADVPMRLLDLRVQVNSGGEAAIEQSDRSRTNLLWQGVSCTVHRQSSFAGLGYSAPV